LISSGYGAFLNFYVLNIALQDIFKTNGEFSEFATHALSNDTATARADFIDIDDFKRESDFGVVIIMQT
jgi:hypothetical protein